MKQAMPEITPQASTQGKKAKEPIEVFSIDYFYKLFLKEKKRYAPSLFSITKSKRKVDLPFDIYKKIVKEFFKIYFYELYFSNISSYFPWGGMIKKVRYPKWRYKNLNGSDGAIGLFWYQRPSKRHYYMIDTIKLTGSTNQLPIIESRFRKNNNMDLLPIFTEERYRLKNSNNLFKE